VDKKTNKRQIKSDWMANFVFSGFKLSHDV
jgi:hypothetical protein